MTAQEEGFSEFAAALFADQNIQKHTHDVKALYAAAERLGAALVNVTMDTMLAGYLLNPSASGYDVLRLAQEYGVPVHRASRRHRRSGRRCSRRRFLRRLCEKLELLVEENGQQKLLHEVEIPLARVLSGMEQVGLRWIAVGLNRLVKCFPTVLAISCRRFIMPSAMNSI